MATGQQGTTQGPRHPGLGGLLWGSPRGQTHPGCQTDPQALREMPGFPKGPELLQRSQGHGGRAERRTSIPMASSMSLLQASTQGSPARGKECAPSTDQVTLCWKQLARASFLRPKSHRTQGWAPGGTGGCLPDESANPQSQPLLCAAASWLCPHHRRSGSFVKTRKWCHGHRRVFFPSAKA